VRSLLTIETTKLQYTHGANEPGLLSPDAWTFDQHFLDRPGNNDIQPGSLLQLPVERGAVRQVARVLPQAPAKNADSLGSERPVLHRGGLNAWPEICVNGRVARFLRVPRQFRKANTRHSRRFNAITDLFGEPWLCNRQVEHQMLIARGLRSFWSNAARLRWHTRRAQSVKVPVNCRG